MAYLKPAANRGPGPGPASGTIDDVQACPRCQGFMVDDWLLDMAQGGCLWETGRRCVNCGHIAPTGTTGDPARAERRRADDGLAWHAAA